MADVDLSALKGRRSLALEIATRATDPRFYAALEVLPNPDTVLRRLGQSQDVYDDIVGDAHVIGELRSIRSALLGYEWRLQAGGDLPADLRALELCEAVMARRPAPGMTWSDVVWTMGCGVFRGFAVHEVVWERQDRVLMPSRVLDRAQRRFVFGVERNELRLLTRQDMLRGIELGELKWLVSRHMASHDNPYGVAIFSACFWPYVFKHSGFKFFVKFVEKYGIPWAVGKYPPGTPESDQQALADQLAQMVEDGVAAIPSDGSVELLESTHSGELVHERMMAVCNREMSKALTSQTLATELADVGARAASETHRERELSVNASDRALIENTFNELFGWITELNVQGAVPPRFEFYEEAEARQDWTTVIDKARRYVQIPAAWAHERLQIPEPKAGEDLLPGFGTAPEPPAGAMFARAGASLVQDADLDELLDALTGRELQGQVEAVLAPVLELAREAPDELLGRLAERYPDMDDAALQELLARVIFVAETWGRLDAGSG
ncbi:MAG: DUF935 family protein [Gammaproteobacteria bacterium]|nr:DUF935 family protein [Gammaproteobacteria bacterium]